MSELTDRDWEQVNAYHDGEMSPDVACDFNERLANEPELAAALMSISEVSVSLSALRPGFAETRSNVAQTVQGPANSNCAPLTWLAGGAVAAGLLVAMVFGSIQFAAETPLNVHKNFAAQKFKIEERKFGTVSTFAVANLPDLQGANLVPVALRDFGGGTVAHYAGRNGCRLSYFRGGEQLSTSGVQDGQSAVWTTADGLHHGIIATGLDAEKFAAVSTYLQMVTRQEGRREVYASLITATAAATPCVVG